MVITIPLIVLGILLIALLAFLARTNVKFRALYLKVKKILLFNTFIRVFITGYLGFALLVFNPHKEKEEGMSFTDKLKKKAPFIILCAAIPTFCLWFAVFTETLWLNLPSTKQAWKSLYDGVDTRSTSRMTLYFVFFTRRLIFVVTIV
jgi:hypothetical protein